MTSPRPTDDAPYTLVQIDAPAPSVAPLTLSWHNLSIADPTPAKRLKHKTKKVSTDDANADQPPTMLLDSVSGDAVPGELLAIVGPSSGPMTALLDALAGRLKPTSLTNGSVCVNHQPVQLSPSMVGDVPKDNALYATLTVREHLEFYAQLVLGDDATADNRADRVADVLMETGLTDVAASLIGDGSPDATIGLSKRDRKLLALATELLTNPSVLVLEEPLAGLSGVDAEAVVSRLQALARNSHTVVFSATLDQPTSAMFSMVDKLHILAAANDDGRCATVFHGPPTESLAFFQSKGVVCPPRTNPFEFFARQLIGTDVKTVSRVRHLVSAWGSTVLPRRGSLGPLHAVDTPVLDATAHGVVRRSNGLGLQLSVLVRRNATRLLHDTASMRGRIVQAIATALFIGLIFLRMDISQLHISSFSSACYLVATTQFSSNALPEVQSLPSEVALVLRDHKNRLYHAMHWYLVKNLTELPFQLLYPLVFLLPVYFLIGFPADVEVFFKFYLFLVLVASSAAAAGYFASCVARTPKTAFIIGVAIIIPVALFGGAFVNRKTTPVYLLWIQQSSPVKYGYHGLMRAFWEHIDKIPCPPGTLCRASSGTGVLAMNLVHADKFSSDWHILVLINIALRVAGGLALAVRAAAARK